MSIARWLILLALALPGCAQIIQTGTSVSSGASASCVFQYSVTSGSVIVASSNWEGSTSTPSVTDTLGTTFTQAALNTSNAVKISIYVGTASSSGSDTVSFSVSGGSWQNTRCSEFSGAFTTSTLDGSAVTALYSGTPASVSSNITTTINGDTLIGSIGGFRSASAYASLDNDCFLIVGTQGADSGALEYKPSGTAGTYSVGFSQVGNDQGAIAVIALKPPSGITITNSSTIPAGKNGTAYGYTLGAVGGAGAYTWSVSSGSLPSGLSLSSGGVISGTPSGTGTSTPTIQVTDGTNTATQGITLIIGSSLATISVVQSAFTGGLQTKAFTSNVVAGNLLLSVCSNTGASVAASYPTDSLSTPFNFLSAGSVRSGAGATFFSIVSLFVGVAPSSGADTITCPTGYVTQSIAEIAGVNPVADLYSVTRGTSGGAATVTSSTITPVVANEILIGAGLNYNGTSAVQSPWTTFGHGGQTGEDTGYVIVSSTSGTTVSYALSGATSYVWQILVSGFRAAAGAGGAPGPTATMILQ